MESRPDRDKKGTAQGQGCTTAPRTLSVGVAGTLVTVHSDELRAVLGDDPSREAHNAFGTLCQAGCDREVLLYVLKVMRYRLPCDWWYGGESQDEAKSRRADADVFERAAAIIKQRYALFLPRENMTAEEEQNLRSWDQLAIIQGGLSPLRLLLGVESVADQLRSPDEARREAALRANQDDFDVISRSVLCAYVHRTTRDWHDREVAVLLTQIGNYKSDRRNATLDAEGLRKWRGSNQERLQRLSSWAVDQLLGLRQSDRQSPPGK